MNLRDEKRDGEEMCNKGLCNLYFSPTGMVPVTARLLRLRVRFPPKHGYLSVVSIVCCQVEVSASG
jgi:hypothetical protein